MHIPDGFLDAKVAIVTGAIAIAGVGLALRRVEASLPPRRVPLLGLGAAFVFTAQMLNFPIGGGTSGHLIGGVLITALLGPAAAVVVLTTVLLTQCFLFADGGVTALGANVMNMAIIAPLTGALLLGCCRRLIGGRRGLVVGAAFASWVSVVVASVACAAQLAWSGTVEWHVALPAMAGVHAVIGIGEGIITALVVVAVLRARPDLLERHEAIAAAPSSRRARLAAAAVIVALIALVPLASAAPDGLERIAEALGFSRLAVAAAAPMSDYTLPGVAWAWLGSAVAAVIGTLVAFGGSCLLARLLVPRTRGD